MIRLFTMFLVCFNAILAKLVIYFISHNYKIVGHLCLTGTEKHKNPYAHDNKSSISMHKGLFITVFLCDLFCQKLKSF